MQLHHHATRATALALIMSLAGGAALAQSGPTTADLALWLKADDGLAADGSTWTDQSGNGHNAMAIVAPTVVSGAINGLPAASFTGTQSMTIAGEVVTKQHFTILAVVTDTAPTTNTSFREIISNWDPKTLVKSIFLGTVWGTVNDASADRIRFTDAVGGEDQGQTGQGQIANPTSVFVLSGVAGASNAIVRVGSKVEYRLGAPLPPRTLGKPWFLGKQGSSNFEFWNGYIAEVLVYNDALSIAELKTDLAYLKAKWQPPVKK